MNTTNTTDDEQPKIDERKTRELCGCEREGLRCMLPKGHDKQHEAYNANRTIRWG